MTSPTPRTPPRPGSAPPPGENSHSTLRRGMSVLFTLGGTDARAAGGLGVVRIAELLGLDKSQVSRTLRTLAECGAVERDPATRLYRLGWQMARLGNQAAERYVEHVASPVLDELVDRWQEAAHLSVRQGDQMRTVLTREAPRHVRALDPEGTTAPVHCTSTGRALLLDHSRDELVALLGEGPLPTATSRSIPDVDALAARLAQDRARGYAVVADEWETGLTSVAAPVRDASGIVAALNVSGPSDRMRLVADRLGDDLVVVAAAVGTALRRAAGQPAGTPGTGAEAGTARTAG